MHSVSRAAFAALCVAAFLSAVVLASPPLHPRVSGDHMPSVAILGGGIGGLSAAQELAERGFSVTVCVMHP